MHKNSTVTKKELKGIIGIGSTAIDNNIDYLKNNGFLERVGGDKGGRWLIHYKTS
jgi:ATP-dependent DNA helicase RecG